MAKEITEIDDSSHANKKAIAQIRNRDKGSVDFNNSKIPMPMTLYGKKIKPIK